MDILRLELNVILPYRSSIKNIRPGENTCFGMYIALKSRLEGNPWPLG